MAYLCRVRVAVAGAYRSRLLPFCGQGGETMQLDGVSRLPPQSLWPSRPDPARAVAGHLRMARFQQRNGQ